MFNQKLYFQKTPWTWNHVLPLLFMIFVLVPFFIEYLLKQYLTESFRNDLYAGTLSGLIMAIIFTVSLYLIAIKPLNINWSDVGIRRFKTNYWLPIVGWTLGVIIASILIVILMDLFINVSTENSKTESLRSQLNIFTFFTGFISAAVISPLYEELFYRGFLYRFFRNKYGMTGGLFISSFIFMLVHIPTFNTLPVNLITGLVFAWTYEKTGSIWPGVIIHGTFNGIAIILTALGS
ncbi:CPBP family intramembrane glutamic endopeptidase [Ferdinandcohnia quinoae]|uniref:CPBP family intramembrane metalloprotease n=1 Tax=Fredinandcohnia quinoae TaxID=2918902 RepID=A0AAW5ED03_9BACI|nr:type II CAAX endopeptidase family protein [Fredinandcohnia sp. SECRCQ15]MCH1627787.1 CPBP family intramembrane metalloprotease [Fredinandcohnia sp. SECRCQ15]